MDSMRHPVLISGLALVCLCCLSLPSAATSTTAANADGESAKTTAPTTTSLFPPNAPTALKATRLSATQVKLEWNHDHKDVTDFYIYRAKGTEPWNKNWGDTTNPDKFLPITVNASQTNYTDENADADFPYRYVVKATNTPQDWQHLSDPSNEVAEYSAKVTLLAGVAKTPLPQNHPMPTGVVHLTNQSGKPDDTMNSPFDTYVPWGDPANGEQERWEKSRIVTRKMGAAYTLDVSVQTDGKFVTNDSNGNPLYDIGYLFGNASAGPPSLNEASPVSHVETNSSHATLEAHGQFSLLLGKLEPAPATQLGYDAASNPRWLALPENGSSQVHFTVVPGGGSRTKSFSFGEPSTVTPTETPLADKMLTLQIGNEGSKEKVLTASVSEAGEVARLNVDVRMHRNLAVAMIVLTQDYSHRRGVIPDSIPPTKAPTASALQTHLNNVFTPQTNISVTVTRYEVSADYDVGTTVPNGWYDWNNSAEEAVLKNIIAQYSGFDKYVFYLHEIGNFPVAGQSSKNRINGIAKRVGGDFCVIHDFTGTPLETGAHELGHLLGLNHVYDNDPENHPGYLPHDNFSDRIMAGGYPGRKRLLHGEWKVMYEHLFNLQQP